MIPLHASKNAEKNGNSEALSALVSALESIDGRLSAMVERWAGLDEETRERILQLAGIE